MGLVPVARRVDGRRAAVVVPHQVLGEVLREHVNEVALPLPVAVRSAGHDEEVEALFNSGSMSAWDEL